MSDYDFYKLDVEKAKEVFGSDWDLLWGDEVGEGWGLYDIEVDKVEVKNEKKKEFVEGESPINIDFHVRHNGAGFYEDPKFKLKFHQVVKYVTSFDLRKKFHDSPIDCGLQDIYEWSTERLENGRIRFQFILHSGMKTEIECKEVRFVRVK